MHRSAEREFPRQARLTQARDYRAVFAGAERIADRYFTILVGRNKAGTARLGLAISRRRARRAVDRNRLKRLVREHFRHKRRELGNLDCVVMAGPAAAGATRATLNASLERLWQRVARTCEASSSRSSEYTGGP